MKSVAIFLLITFMLSTNGWAYILPYWMIMSKTAESHGRGIYVIDQDVIFQTADEPLVVNERWTIAGENDMRVEVTGRRQLKGTIRLTLVYDNGKKYFIDENGVKKVARIPTEFFERVFHFRFSKNIKPYLVGAKVVPSETLRSEPHKASKTRPQPESEKYVQFARSGGVVTYKIGSLWIEQDRFAVRKIRYPSQTLIVAKDYQKYSQGLELPKEREVTFEGHNVEIMVNSVSRVSSSTANKAKLSHRSLNFGKDPKLALLLPTDPVLRAFYSRLR